MLYMKTLKSLLVFLCFSQLSYATVYYCQDSGSVELDMFTSGRPNNITEREEAYRWIVDTSRGWRRADINSFSGACVVDKGYTVCKADRPYGEAIFSIHPDDSNFILIYVDYGMDLLAFVGNCNKA
tara:strand:+ start:369 stop:746 length:378 start_codon:yes stop_codon:yes gene_type:complete